MCESSLRAELIFERWLRRVRCDPGFSTQPSANIGMTSFLTAMLTRRNFSAAEAKTKENNYASCIDAAAPR
jgi:hypothetical protein